jgi:hypothetical protein
MAGVGSLTRIAKGAAYIVHSDELLSAFLELEARLLAPTLGTQRICLQSEKNFTPRDFAAGFKPLAIFSDSC